MDTVVINSIFGKRIIALLLRKYIRNKFRMDVNVDIDSVDFMKNEEAFNLQISLRACGKSDELLKINRILEKVDEEY